MQLMFRLQGMVSKHARLLEFLVEAGAHRETILYLRGDPHLHATETAIVFLWMLASDGLTKVGDCSRYSIFAWV